MTWSPEFEKILQRNLPLSRGPVLADVSLSALGLDSLATVSLVMDLEDNLNISIPDSSLIPETFETAAALWRVVADLVEGSVT
ncbi:phosphopantetheine-binding protein [Streptomyces scopuliridis]|uniref:phosphopantetheine-binding protein n=1 Tax=Streptomyces scopuliridis TaxID=452529 RepID=UPI0036ADB5F4